MFPDTVRHRARLALRDTLGVMLGGADTAAARSAAAVCELDGAGAVEVFTTGVLAGRVSGAMANAVAASSLDFDDGHVLGGSIHPGAAIVPALLACGAGEGLTVENALEALVLGYEVAIRAGYLLWPPDRSHQAHLAGTPAAIGGAVGCAKLLRLPPDGIRRALEIGWSHAPLARLQFPMVKESLGWAAASAVGAALLADCGFKSCPPGVRPFAQDVHPPTGFDIPAAVADGFVASLGTVWEIENTYFKPYAACRFTHSAVDVLKQLFRDGMPSPENVVQITVSTHREAAYLDGRTPGTVEEGQYSFPWVLAVLIKEGGVGATEMSQERLSDAGLRELAGRVFVQHDPALDAAYPEAYPSRVTVSLKDGRRLEHQVFVALGSSDRPMSDAELEAKFVDLAEPRLGARAHELSELVMTGEREALRDLMALLSRHPASDALR
jgi:2-methylcitrate dehydratase PrpD